MSPSPWPRRLLILGAILMVVGALDPLEGSVVVLAGTAIAAIGARRQGGGSQQWLAIALVLVVIGVGFMWGLSAVGGFGGSTGRSLWWWAAIVPYPVGWVLGLAGTIRSLRRHTPSVGRT